MEVSRNAITMAIGAFENAYMMHEKAKKEAKPPPKKTHFAERNILGIEAGDTKRI